MNGGAEHGVAQTITSRVGVVLLLFLIWWAILIFQALTPFQYVKQSDVNFAVALALFFGTLVGAPVIGYLICADLIAKQLAFPWNVITFVGLFVVGFGLYMVVHQSKTQVPLHTVSDIWRVYSGALLPFLAVAAVLLVRRLRKSM